MKDRFTRSGGFTLVEVLFGLLILGLVMTTSLAVFYERERRIQYAEDSFLVWQAISNEAELIRFQPWPSIGKSGKTSFQSDLAILDPLENVTTTISVTESGPSVKKIVLQVDWGEGRTARTTVIRSDTGGSNLW